MQRLASGTFRSLAHPGSGVAVLLQLPRGERLLRLENLAVGNGPDLRVYLSAAPAEAEEADLGRRFVDLGALKGNKGNQNYALPANASATDYRSVVIWCRRFSVAFAVAPLTPKES